ncbi:MAG TPA: Abi-alpha family protein [Nocardioidaceae bacterium]|nr:Abi-alpha family protein [Nocardioidaceae bacterium]
MTEYDDRLPAARGENLPAPALDALPGLMRLAATSWLRTTEWGLVAGARGARAVVRAATNPGEIMDFAQNVVQASSVVADLAKAVSSGVPIPQAVVEVSASITGPQAQSNGHKTRQEERQERAAQSLREQGEALLMRSRDVWNTDQGHPAYARILSELAPDEGRILMLLLKSGPQPSVDVRTGGPVGMVSSRLVKSGMTMIGPRAGVRYIDQVPSYLHNLFRLGLIWFSREQLSDPLQYQVVEAQPDVLEAMHSVRAHKVVRRSIHLTPFGEDFCRAVLVSPDFHADLPTHLSPNDGNEPPSAN